MSVYYRDDRVTLLHGQALDELRTLPDGSVDCCVTSPPYFGLRDYGVDGQIGAEKSPAEFVERLRVLFAEVRRVLVDDGTLWLNLGDSYSTRKVTRDSSHQPGFHPNRTDHDTIGKSWVENRATGNVRMPSDTDRPEKNLLGIPWRVAFALQDDGWILRNAIIWHKPNAMPESVTDRLATRYEHLFLFSQSRTYWFDLDPIREEILWPEKIGHIFGGNHPDVGRRRGAKYLPANRGTYRAADGEQHLGGHAQGRNPGDVWEVPTTPFPGAHFAVFPPEIPRRCIAAGCKPGGTVLDPFSGSGTTGMVAQKLGRRYIGIDLNADYLDLSLKTRLHTGTLDFEDVR